MTGVLYQAAVMAQAGFGWEDIFVKLSEKGLTRSEARTAVFGRAAARRMMARERIFSDLEKAS